MKASKVIGVSSFPTLDLLTGPWAMASSSSFLAELAGILTQKLYRVMQDPKAIAKDGGLNMILSNGLPNLLDMELLEL